HMKLGYTSLGEKPVERFGTTPPKKLDYAAYYYHPRGAAQRATVVVDGTCHSMSVQKTGPGGTASGSAPASPDTATSDAAATDGSNADADGGATDTSSGSDAGTGGAYVGVRYGTRTDTSTGCHRYFFSFVDSDGFTHRYPEYGTLGAKIVETQDDQGNTIYLVDSNDESCPVWSPKSVGQSCLPQGDQCVDGETRSCYTGKPNTRGKGICTRGTERCENGHWSGTCEGETTPKPAETCGNGKDDNCNGHADEGCDDGSESPDAGSDGGVAPAPDVSTDAGVRYTGGGGNGGGGCSTPGGPPAAPAPLALIALAGLARSRRRFE
ncbi:MAG: MYXO-CTERM sorting domain-containing protein, partial [Bradymonadaceae bacterium]